MAPHEPLDTLQSPGWFGHLSWEGPPGEQDHLDADRGGPGSTPAHRELPASPGVRQGPSSSPGLGHSGSEAQPSLGADIQRGPRADA